MAPPSTFDPKQVIVNFGGSRITGYADGTFINIERNSDSFETVSGADGAVSRAATNDRTGLCTLSLQQTSNSNIILSQIARIDEKTGKGIVPFSITDLSGTTTFVSAYAWIRKVPSWEAGKTINNVQWPIELADLDPNIGGNQLESIPGA